MQNEQYHFCFKIIPPRGDRHTHTVMFLHGRDSNAKEFCQRAVWRQKSPLQQQEVVRAGDGVIFCWRHQPGALAVVLAALLADGSGLVGLCGLECR